MYSKLSIKRLIISLLVIIAMILLLKITFFHTNEFAPPRFLGIGAAMLGLGAALVVLSPKDIFYADGKKVTIKDFKKGLMAINPRTTYISEKAETLSASEEMKGQLKRLSQLETIQPFLSGGLLLMIIGGFMSLVSFLYIIHIFK